MSELQTKADAEAMRRRLLTAEVHVLRAAEWLAQCKDIPTANMVRRELNLALKALSSAATAPAAPTSGTDAQESRRLDETVVPFPEPPQRRD